jgi:ethanolamine ammonia-lyase small subunit
MDNSPTQDLWSHLRQFTAARIGLGRSGAAIPTGETLRFKLAHAKARDAVHTALDIDQLLTELRELPELAAPSIQLLHSAACDRLTYLQRPDLGRRLAPGSSELLRNLNNADAPPADLALVIADGLSARAVQRNAAPLLGHLAPLLGQRLRLAPLCLVTQGRVAIGDEIGHLLHARCVAILIGERPGLSSPDSLGVYLTFAPKPGLTDERRNCLSNIRPEGLPWPSAAAKLAWLIEASLTRQLSGVGLKDETTTGLLPWQAEVRLISN